MEDITDADNTVCNDFEIKHLGEYHDLHVQNNALLLADAFENLKRKTNSKYMEDYDKNKELLYLQYYDIYNFYGWAMLQKLPVNVFEWIKNTS